MHVGIEGYLYEAEKADYPNINRSGSDSKVGSVTIHNVRSQETFALKKAI